MTPTPKNGTRTIVVIRRDSKITAIIPAYWYNGVIVTVPQKEATR